MAIQLIKAVNYSGVFEAVIVQFADTAAQECLTMKMMMTQIHSTFLDPLL